MQINEDVGIPLVEHREGCASLRRFGLDVVAIEIQSLCIRANAYHLRTVLRSPIYLLPRELLIAVSIVDRNRDQNHRVQCVRCPRGGEIAQQREQGFLTFYFARVNVALDVDDRATKLRRLLRSGDARARCDHIRDFAALIRLPDRSESQLGPASQ